ncbi:MAG: hypothetical protein A3G34_07010 [Candidatus Lindowbacteria bacterium RIFCSPLOWO2_12_FULL_62_27]|nr:MAG: hypothetical protein A3G34_07010 [Candidatus Lindowbacteria bacterium RIFCSPLOWO2_12_FULL_62_27]OGH61292.1 MAG: hypothetical protein A3I06_03415 [Candidatus Lindowbacteria bacterium RIFCSPLOWO2_02_FULL_62_12]
MSVYAITGGCGFIGSHIAGALVSNGGHSKARRILGYAPAFSLADGLKELVASVRLTARAG